MAQHISQPASSFSEPTQVTLRSPAELAEALPYLMGFEPEESIVIVALHGPQRRFGGRLRFDLPNSPNTWSDVAEQLANYLVQCSERRLGKPDGAVVFLCGDPSPSEEGPATVERLRPLAQHLRIACGQLDVPVYEAMCVSTGKWWSYVCHDPGCCSQDGTLVDRSGTSVIAAATAFAGVRIRGGLREIAGRFDQLPDPVAKVQERALDTAAPELVSRVLHPQVAPDVRKETAALLKVTLDRFRSPSSPSGSEDGVEPSDAADALQREVCADRRDDMLLSEGEAARLILGLQDRVARDHAIGELTQADAAPALRLWRALARRCVGAFQEFAAAPLTLAGWAAWSSGDEIEARVAFHRALAADPDYICAKLMHQACNAGLDPQSLRDRFSRDDDVVKKSGW